MRKILVIARLTFLLALRNGMVWGTLGLTAGTAVFIFFASTGDNVLLNELKLRIHYSYALSYSLLTLIVISISCFTVRSQIDARQIHLLTALPISRRDIWIGKWLGLTLIAALAECVLIVVIFLSSSVYCRSYSAEEAKIAKDNFLFARYENKPVTVAIEEKISERIETLVRETDLARNEVNEKIWNSIEQQVRREHQLVPTNGGKSWHFKIKRAPREGEKVDLEFRFYAENRRTPIQGTWTLSAPGKVEAFTADFSALPYEFNTIRIPAEQIPASGEFDLRFNGKDNPEVIFGIKTGVRIYQTDVTLLVNIIKAFCAQLIHLSVTAAVGLTAGVAFTFSVASFFSIVLYLLSLSSGFFAGVANELTHRFSFDLMDRIGIGIINFGIWLTKGLDPPDIIASLSSGISIPIHQLLLQWGPGIFIYGVVVALLGICLLTRKELDKILI